MSLFDHRLSRRAILWGRETSHGRQGQASPDSQRGSEKEDTITEQQTKRRVVSKDRPQQVTRIPPFRPGMWVKIKSFDTRELGSDLSGKVRKVKSLTCSITSPDQKSAVWRVHFEDGRCLEWHMIERVATDQEVRFAQTRPS